MPRKIIQDIFVVKKSIRMVKRSDIKKDPFSIEKKVPIRKTTDEKMINDRFVEEENKYDDTSIYEEKNKGTKNSIIYLWIILIAAVAVLLFILSSTFSTATIKITPKNQDITLNDTYNITSDKTVGTSTLHFQVMTIEQKLTKALETDGEEYVEKKAIGKAVIFNNSGTQKQRLTINTRLETKDGLIYRIRDSVDVPGIKTIAGVKTPGSIEVDIIADMPGDKYNMKLSDLKGDFTIPGFKGTTKYTTFYARLSADVLGGFTGNVKKVSEDKLTEGRTDLKNNLSANLIKEAYSKTPTDNILFKDNYYIQCTDLPDDSATSAYNISEDCTINAIIFDRSDLALFIAVNRIKSFDNSKVDILWNDNDTVSLLGVSLKPWNETTLKAKFTGPAKVVWAIDTNQILQSILGQDKSVISTIISNNKNSINEIQTTIIPIWNNTFPKYSSKIKIIDTLRDQKE